MMTPGFGDRLKARRKELGWTLDGLAQCARLSKTFVWEMEAGSSRPSADTLVSLSDAMGVSLEWLAKGRETRAVAFDAARVRKVLAELNGLLAGGGGKAT